MRAVYPYFPNPLIAKALGRSEPAVAQKGPQMGLRKTSRGRSNGAKYAQARRNRDHEFKQWLDEAVARILRKEKAMLHRIALRLRRYS